MWDAERERLLWVDIDAGALHAYDERGGDTCTLLGRPLSLAIPRANGGLVLALEHDFALLDEASAELRVLATLPDSSAERLNDGRCDSRGRLWAGTLAAAPGGAALYRLDPGGRLLTVLDGVTTSNGIDWSPDERRMYYVDSATQRVDVFAFDPATARLSRRRTFAEIDPREGEPDGLTVDALGRVWVAIWGAGVVRCFQPDGRRLADVSVPTALVSSCAFGGPSLGDLFITSARQTEQTEASDPGAGALFRLAGAGTGRPVNRFAG